jgi:hypothetical protein
MDLRQDVALMALANTTDPQLAAKLATQLGSDMLRVDPKVNFPPAWVLSQQRGPVELAAYAIKYCDDPATLAKIARSSRRVAVKIALVSNCALSNEWRNQITTGDQHNYAVSSAAREFANNRVCSDPIGVLTKATTEDLDLLTQPHSKLITNALAALGSHDDQVTWLNKLIKISQAQDDGWLARLAICTYYKVPGSGCSFSPALAEVGQDATELLDLSDRDRSRTLELLLKATVRCSTREVPFDTGITQRMLWDVDLMRSQSSFSALSPVSWFSPAAIDLIMNESPRREPWPWYDVLLHHRLTDPQFKRFIDETPILNRESLFGKISFPEESHRERVEYLLGSLPAHVPYTSPELAQEVCRIVADQNDPLYTALFSRAASGALAAYISGKWRVNDQQLVADVADLPALVLRLGSHFLTKHLVASALNQNLPMPYVHALLDIAPGALGDTMSDLRVSSYIYERLATTGVDIELALDQLSAHPDEPLDHLIAVLQSMAQNSYQVTQ